MFRILNSTKKNDFTDDKINNRLKLKLEITLDKKKNIDLLVNTLVHEYYKFSHNSPIKKILFFCGIT